MVFTRFSAETQSVGNKYTAVACIRLLFTLSGILAQSPRLAGLLRRTHMLAGLILHRIYSMLIASEDSDTHADPAEHWLT